MLEVWQCKAIVRLGLSYFIYHIEIKQKNSPMVDDIKRKMIFRWYYSVDFYCQLCLLGLRSREITEVF